jgi:hypothetical protein
MRGAKQRHALGDERIDVQHFGVHWRLAGEFREGTHAPLQRVDFADDDLDGLIHEGAVRRRLPGEHFFDRQANRREQFLSSWAVFRASDCQLAICVSCTSARGSAEAARPCG